MKPKNPENQPPPQALEGSSASLNEHTAPMEERRSSLVDRRETPRQGKLDRRRNRCGVCVYFKSAEPETADLNEEGNKIDESCAGFCEQHQTTMQATNFACVLFQGAK